MRLRCLLAFTCVLVLAPIATACTIPVFRFALDRWEADPFELVLPPAVARDGGVADLLRPLRAGGHANLRISDAAALTEAELRFGGEHPMKLWNGALTADALAGLLDSPARRQITDQILAGESIVWVIVDRGSTDDLAQLERVQKRLKFLEQVAALPVQNPDDPDSQLGPGPALKLQFAVLRVRADDPQEQSLIKMLAGPENAVHSGTTSFAAAVFGRGRVLRAWALPELDEAALEDACMFLVGRCSCRVKNGNPGWDLLLNLDWDQALREAGKQTAEHPAPAASQPVAETTVVQSIESSRGIVTTAMTIQSPPPQGKARNRGSLIVGGSALALTVAGIAMWRSGRARK